MANIRARRIGYALLGLFLLVNVVCGIFLLVRNEPRPVPRVETAVPATTMAVVREEIAPAVDPHHVPVLAITKALYGDLPNGPKVDVTVKVAAMVENNALSVDASNDNFGDPAENIVKTLRVDFAFDGQERSKSAPENDMLTISATGQ
jgi:hypothetical protein